MSKLFILAENRSEAPVAFVIDAFSEAPAKEGRIVLPAYDQQKEPSFLFRYAAPQETRPGLSIKLDIEVNYETQYNDLGPKIWFRMPRELRGKFFCHKLLWNGKSLMKTKGMLL